MSCTPAATFCTSPGVEEAGTESKAAFTTPVMWQPTDNALSRVVGHPPEQEEMQLLMEPKDVFVRRMGAAFEAVSDALFGEDAESEAGEAVLDEACSESFRDRVRAAVKAKPRFSSQLQVQGGDVIEYLEFASLEDEQTRRTKKSFHESANLFLSMDDSWSFMVRNAGKMLNVMMTRGVPPALGDVIQGSVIFARVRVRLDCMERRGATAADAAAAEPQPTTHVITVEIPFQPLKFDDVAMPSEEASAKASSQDSAPAKGEDTAAAAAEESQGKGARDAEPHAEKQAHEEAPQDAAERDGEEGSGASAGSSDALPAIPQGLKPTSDGEVPLTKDGRPVVPMRFGPVAPTQGWRLVDINGVQPVTASDHAFVSRMLARRQALMGEEEEEEGEGKGGEQG